MSVVLLAADCESTRILYHALSPLIPFAAIVIESPVPRLEFLTKRVKRLGMLRVAGQVLFQGAIVPSLRRRARARVAELKAEHGFDGSPLPEHLVRRASSANAPETRSLLAELSPKVVVVSGTRILSRELLTSVPATFINVHAGVTPLYRGVHGGYWALAEGDPENCGVTVHLVNEGIDTGGIIAQARVTPRREDSFVTYHHLQLAAAIPLLSRAIQDALAGTLRTVPPPVGPSRLHSHPTAWEYLVRRATRGVR